MELNLNARQMAWWHRLTALKQAQLMALAADVEATGEIDATVIKVLTDHHVVTTGLEETPDAMAQQVLSLMSMAESSASIATLLAGWWQVANQLKIDGTVQQKQTYLEQPALMGVSAQPQSVSAETTVTAVPDANGWRLSGTVVAVINGTTAQTYLVLAQMPTAESATFLISAKATGLAIINSRTLLGLRGLAVTDLTLTNVHVTAADQLGGRDQGQTIMQRVQTMGRLFTGAITAGILTHAQTLVQQLTTGEQPPLAELAPLVADNYALQTAVLMTAQRLDDQEAGQLAAIKTALVSAQLGQRGLTELTPLMGTLAYSAHSPLMGLQRDLQTLPFLTGTPADLQTALATVQLTQPRPESGPSQENLPQKLAVSDLHRVVKQLHLTNDVPVNVGSIATAKRIVALGQGALDPAVLIQAQQLAKWIGAALAVTQPLTALEQFSIDQEIGGQAVVVAPEVLINIGISGDEDYLAGMAGAQHVLSVNQDEQAPLMGASQQIFVGTAAEFLDGMVAALN